MIIRGAFKQTPSVVAVKPSAGGDVSGNVAAGASGSEVLSGGKFKGQASRGVGRPPGRGQSTTVTYGGGRRGGRRGGIGRSNLNNPLHDLMEGEKGV